MWEQCSQQTSTQGSFLRFIPTPSLRHLLFYVDSGGGLAQGMLSPKFGLEGKPRSQAPPPSFKDLAPQPPLCLFIGAKPQNARNGPLGRCHLNPGPPPPPSSAPPHTVDTKTGLP